MDLDSTFFASLQRALKAKSAPVCETLPSGAKALIASAFLQNHPESILYLSASSSNPIVEDLEFFGQTALELPQSSELEASSDVKGAELKTLAALKENPARLISASIQALLRQFINPDALHIKAKSFSVGDTYPFLKLDETFKEMGYEPKSIVLEKGQFAKRGGIID